MLDQGKKVPKKIAKKFKKLKNLFPVLPGGESHPEKFEAKALDGHHIYLSF